MYVCKYTLLKKLFNNKCIFHIPVCVCLFFCILFVFVSIHESNDRAIWLSTVPSIQLDISPEFKCFDLVPELILAFLDTDWAIWISNDR